MPDTMTPYFDLETFFEKCPPVFTGSIDPETAGLLAGALLSWLDLPKGFQPIGRPVSLVEGNALGLPAGLLARIEAIDPTDAALPYRIGWVYRDSSNGRHYADDGWASEADFTTGPEVVE